MNEHRSFLVAVRDDATIRALGTVSFGRDASVYLRPVGQSGGGYDYGYTEVPAGVGTWTFTTSGQLQASERPHVSIHESGGCHVRAGRDRASKIEANAIGPLNNLTGHHVGTVFTSRVADLAPLAAVWPDRGAPDEHADVWEVAARGEAGARVAVYVSRWSMRARGSLGHREVRLQRSDGGALFVAAELWPDTAELGVATVGAIGGWDPITAVDASSASRFVFVRSV